MLEGNDNKSWWDWKDTLGPLKDRPGFSGVWGYQQTHGLGLMEYLEWAEDMDLEISKHHRVFFPEFARRGLLIRVQLSEYTQDWH